MALKQYFKKHKSYAINRMQKMLINTIFDYYIAEITATIKRVTFSTF